MRPAAWPRTVLLVLLVSLWAAVAEAAPRQIIFLTTSDLQSQLEPYVITLRAGGKPARCAPAAWPAWPR